MSKFENKPDVRCFDSGGFVGRYLVVFPDLSYLHMNTAPLTPSGFIFRGNFPEQGWLDAWIVNNRPTEISFFRLPDQCQKIIFDHLEAACTSESS